jgi:hypothetical protein
MTANVIHDLKLEINKIITALYVYVAVERERVMWCVWGLAFVTTLRGSCSYQAGKFKHCNYFRPLAAPY